MATLRKRSPQDREVWRPEANKFVYQKPTWTLRSLLQVGGITSTGIACFDAASDSGLHVLVGHTFRVRLLRRGPNLLRGCLWHGADHSEEDGPATGYFPAKPVRGH